MTTSGDESLELVFVLPMEGNKPGIDGLYHYKLFFSDTPEDVWGIDWEIDNVSSTYEDIEDCVPDSTTYSKIMGIGSELPLKTIEETTCYSMEYATYDIIALSWIDIDRMDVYPENGRMVFHFGQTMKEIREILEKNNIREDFLT